MNVILNSDEDEGILAAVRLEGFEWEGRRLKVQLPFLKGLEDYIDDPEELERELAARAEAEEKEKKKAEEEAKLKDLKDGDMDDDFKVIG